MDNGGAINGNAALKPAENPSEYACSIRFQGQWADEETGLYYNRCRFYDPGAGQWDMGHVPTKEYRKLHKNYMDGNITKDEFLKEYRDPENYQPEDPSENRSHKHEEKMIAKDSKKNDIDDMLFYIRRHNEDEILVYFNDKDCDFVDEYGTNVLHESIAAKKNLVPFFIERGANIDQQDDRGNVPLHYAAERQQYESATALLEAGARLDLADDYGNQPLWTAVFNGRSLDYRSLGVKLVKQILRNGADPHHKNNANLSPLELAVECEDDEYVQILQNDVE